MEWAQKQHAAETLAEWGAPTLLGLSAGWAAIRLGLPIAAVAALLAAAFVTGLFVMRLAGRTSPAAIAPFEAPEIEPVEPEWEELLLEPKDELLILDDPLIEPAADSRVVRLFERQEPTPGELVDRIADFLGEGRHPAPAAKPAAMEQPVADASAALHAALANIRASLR